MRKFVFFLFLLWSFSCQAQLQEYKHAYDVNLDEEIPLVWRVRKEYEKNSNEYDWHYDLNWRIPSNFDSDFKDKIEYFGAIEKRINNPDEEQLLLDLQRIPKSFYPYIGPVLHTVRGLSGKILDLPGIKGTKHKFPEKIAKRMQKIPDIEFASPDMYLFLSPQFWGEEMNTLEFPKKQKKMTEHNPNVWVNPEFINKIRSNVKISDYTQDNPKNKPGMGIRHYTADKNTPLSGADVKAFLNVFDNLQKFRQTKDNELRLIMITPLIQYWDEKNGLDANAAFLKEAVNPCQTIIRKVRWAGLQKEFQSALNSESFGNNDWAYTCDKIIKAYRIINMPLAYATTLNLLKKGILYPQLDEYTKSAEERKALRYFTEAVIYMYDSNEANIRAVQPFNKELTDKLESLSTHFAGTPVLLP